MLYISCWKFRELRLGIVCWCGDYWGPGFPHQLPICMINGSVPEQHLGNQPIISRPSLFFRKISAIVSFHIFVYITRFSETSHLDVEGHLGECPSLSKSLRTSVSIAEFSVHEVSRVYVRLRGGFPNNELVHIGHNTKKTLDRLLNSLMASLTLSALWYQVTMKDTTSTSQTPLYSLIPVFALNSSSIKAHNQHSSSIAAPIFTSMARTT